MGWNGYNAFGCAPELDEAKVRATMDALVASGMQSAGYQYVNLDDCWQLPRTAEGTDSSIPCDFRAASRRFRTISTPWGFRSEFGLPSRTARQEPGSEGYETVDAETYAAWGVDYVKYVNCCCGAERRAPCRRWPTRSRIRGDPWC